MTTGLPHRVLANLRSNLELNKGLIKERTGSADVSVQHLDWTDYAPPNCGKIADNDVSEEERGRDSLKTTAAATLSSVSRPMPVADTNISSPAGTVTDKLPHAETITRQTAEIYGDGLGTPDVLLAADVVYDQRCDVRLVLSKCRRGSVLSGWRSTLRNAATASVAGVKDRAH